MQWALPQQRPSSGCNPRPARSKRKGPRSSLDDAATGNNATSERAPSRTCGHPCNQELHKNSNGLGVSVEGTVRLGKSAVGLVKAPSTEGQGAGDSKGAAATPGLAVQPEEELPEPGRRNGHVREATLSRRNSHQGNPAGNKRLGLVLSPLVSCRLAPREPEGQGSRWVRAAPQGGVQGVDLRANRRRLAHSVDNCGFASPHGRKPDMTVSTWPRSEGNTW